MTTAAAAVVADRTGCAGSTHGTATAYKSNRCRCPDALTATRRQRKQWQAGLRPPLLVPILGTARRLQALAAIGWDAPRLATMLGAHLDQVCRVRAGRRPYVTRPVARRVAALYEQLQGTPGPSALTRTRATRRGWAPPLAWDDDNIDDPHAQPQAGPVARTGTAAERAATITALTKQGLSKTTIAAHLGVSVRTVGRHRARTAS